MGVTAAKGVEVTREECVQQGLTLKLADLGALPAG